MGYRLTPIISKIMSVLNKHGLEVKRMKGDHIIVNKKEGSLRRPIVLVNEKKLSNAVRLNLIKECEEIGINKEEFEDIF
jgi:predicted RNA binding protein YcfA (HicA-like mRNA interferase family)